MSIYRWISTTQRKPNSGGQIRLGIDVSRARGHPTNRPRDSDSAAIFRKPVASSGEHAQSTVQSTADVAHTFANRFADSVTDVAACAPESNTIGQGLQTWDFVFLQCFTCFLTQVTQFKVKSASALMPDDKKDRNKLPNYKKKNRKSPAGSPDPPPTANEPPIFGLEQQPSGRDEVQSPAYSDISDDGAPVLDQEMNDKSKNPDKKTDMGQPLPHMPQYGMYPFYGQPPYLVPTVQENKVKEPEKVADKPSEKDVVKKEGTDYQQKVLQQHYYPYSYVPGYTYNMDPAFGSSVPVVPEEKIKEERGKENPSPSEHAPKPAAPIPNPIQVPTPGKVKSEMAMKEKHQNENHQILKESIEMKNQMNSYMYSRQQQQQQSMGQREEDGRRFYVYPEQRRKDQVSGGGGGGEHKSGTPNKAPPVQSPSLKHKEKVRDKSLFDTYSATVQMVSTL